MQSEDGYRETVSAPFVRKSRHKGIDRPATMLSSPTEAQDGCTAPLARACSHATEPKFYVLGGGNNAPIPMNQLATNKPGRIPAQGIALEIRSAVDRSLLARILQPFSRNGFLYLAGECDFFAQEDLGALKQTTHRLSDLTGRRLLGSRSQTRWPARAMFEPLDAL
eukprot:scaffold4768_cov412-Prasinococcus_capsulatus_cf.AAC.25